MPLSRLYFHEKIGQQKKVLRCWKIHCFHQPFVHQCISRKENGRYQRECEDTTGGSGLFREYKGAPVYIKKGEWKGKKVTFAIYRVNYSQYGRIGGTRHGGIWYIGRSNARQGNYENENRTIFKCKTHDSLLPPKKGWIISTTLYSHGGGVNPAPTLSY